MKQSIIAGIELLAVLFAGILAFGSCSLGDAEATRPLSVHRMGYVLDAGDYPKPGQTVEVYAQANRQADVAYAWEGPGTIETIGSGRIRWTIPTEPGEHKLTVTVSDGKAGARAARSMKLVVSDSVAHAVPQNFRMKVSQSSTTANKASGPMTTALSMTLAYRDEAFRALVVQDQLTTDILSSAGETWTIGEDGARTSMGAYAKEMDLSRMAMPQILTIAGLSEGTSLAELGDGLVRVSRKDDGIASTMEYDTRTGTMRSLRTEDEETGYVSESAFTYQVVEGYVFMETMTVSATMRVADEDCSYSQVVNVSDVEVGTVDEEDIMEGVAE